MDNVVLTTMPKESLESWETLVQYICKKHVAWDSARGETIDVQEPREFHHIVTVAAPVVCSEE